MNTFLLCVLGILVAIGWRSILDAAIITIVLLFAIFIFLPCMVMLETWRWVSKRV